MTNSLSIPYVLSVSNSAPVTITNNIGFVTTQVTVARIGPALLPLIVIVVVLCGLAVWKRMNPSDN